MDFVELAIYTKTVREDKRLRYGDNFININEEFDTISFDLENNDHVHLRFEGSRALVKTIINNKTERKVISMFQVPNYLKKHNIDLMKIAEKVPYLQRVLAD